MHQPPPNLHHTTTAQVAESDKTPPTVDAPVTAAGAADASGTGTEAAAVLDMDEIDEAGEAGEVNEAGGLAGTAPGEVGLAAVLGGIGGGDLISGAMTACSGVAAEAATETEEVQAIKVARVEGTATVAEAVQAAKEAIEVAARAANKVGAANTAVLAPIEATNPQPAAVPPAVATAAATTTETIDTAPRAAALPTAAAAAAQQQNVMMPAPAAQPQAYSAMAAQLAALPGYTGAFPYALGSNSDAYPSPNTHQLTALGLYTLRPLPDPTPYTLHLVTRCSGPHYPGTVSATCPRSSPWRAITSRAPAPPRA